MGEGVGRYVLTGECHLAHCIRQLDDDIVAASWGGFGNRFLLNFYHGLLSIVSNPRRRDRAVTQYSTGTICSVGASKGIMGTNVPCQSKKGNLSLNAKKFIHIEDFVYTHYVVQRVR